MTELKLFYTQNSPYARKVRIVAAEKHIELVEEEVVLAEPDNAARQYNPLGKVPVLLLQNNEAVYDSPVIAEFLDAKSPVAHLIPADQGLRMQVKRLEALADGVCDAAVAVMLESRRSADKQDASFIEKQKAKVRNGLQAFEHAISGREWLVDNKYSLADIALACMVGYVSIRFEGEIVLVHEYPNLYAFYQKLLERPIYANTQPAPKY